jgi:hypothetical protein
MPVSLHPLRLDMSHRSTPATVSPLSRSFLDASTAIDDLTRSLADYSRVSTPEPPSHLPRCECDTEDSEYTRAWLAVKAKLESRLVLSAGASYVPWFHPILTDHAKRLGKPCYRDTKHMFGGCRSVPLLLRCSVPFNCPLNLPRTRSVLTIERNRMVIFRILK